MKRFRRAIRQFLTSPQSELYGTPGPFARSFLLRAWDHWRLGPLGEYIWLSRRIPGWMRGVEAVELARVCHGLPRDAVILEIGSFLGCSTVLLAGARKLRSSGRVHCIDPFDASGDAFSVPIYSEIAASQSLSLRSRFDENIRLASLADWVEVHQCRDSDIARGWSIPVDLLFLDGDQSDQGAQETYERWSPHLKIGGLIAVHNSGPREYAPNHGGSRRLVEKFIQPPEYSDIWRVENLTFARKAAR